MVALLLIPASEVQLGSRIGNRSGSSGPAAPGTRGAGSLRPFVGDSTLSFVETGLPNGTWWSVTLIPVPRNGSGPWFSNSTTSTVSFSVASGTYTYLLHNVTAGSTQYVPNNASNISVVVAGANVNVAVSFSSVALYPLLITESGLASGTYWELQVRDASSFAWANGQSTSTTISVQVPAGTYVCAVSSSPAYGVYYSVSPQNASLVIPAVSTLNVTFALETTYIVSFNETGLPAGLDWSAGLTWWDGGSGGGGPAGAVFNIPRPNGTYAYGITGPSGWRVEGVAPSGFITVDGASVTESVTFVPGSTYSLTVAEKGLPAGKGWSIEIAGQNASSSGVGITLRNLTPGRYPFAVPSLGAGEGVTVKDGTTVLGATGTIDLTHSRKISLTFTYRTPVTFTETGLTSGTWSISVKGQKVTEPWDQPITFDLANGTYAYRIGTEVGFKHVSSPTRVVVPATLVVAVTFAPKR